MIHQGIDFHNAGGLETRPGLDGLFISRYPAAVRKHMIQLGQLAAADSSGVELRFCTASDWGSVTLSFHCEYPWAAVGSVNLYKGDFHCGQQTVEHGRRCTIKLVNPPMLKTVNRAAFADSQFAPDVWRMALDGGAFAFHCINSTGCPVRPPTPAETPRTRWLAYGSSITSTVSGGYIHHAANLLGTDVLNKGMCGSCFCERQTAGFLAKEDWDFATLELGVNMRIDFSGPEFRKRAAAFIAALRRGNAGKPIFLITLFPNSDDYLTRPTVMSERNREHRQALRDIAGNSKDKQLHLIEGDTVLSRFAGLSQDLIHPSPAGHVLMGRNLAALLAPSLNLTGAVEPRIDTDTH